MRAPQISDRVKEAPAVALRGLLAGVGQLLLITDKLRNKPATSEDVPQARTPDPAEAATAEPEPTAEAEPTAKAEPEVAAEAAETTSATPPAEPAKRATRKRDFNRTGNVRVLSKEDDATEPAAVAEATPAEAPAEAPAAEAAGPAALPNYDELSVASLRARLRNLTAAQVGELAAYEREHAARPEVITMFERRIAKLEAGG